MANIVTVTLVAPKPQGFVALGAVGINTHAIQTIETRTADSVSAGITKITYKRTVRNHFQTVVLYVSETRALVSTAANANAVAT
jgi:hypothetical protein